MKAAHRFRVEPTIPASLHGLSRLAANLRWTWDLDTQQLFERLDPVAWRDTGGNPVEVLQRVSPGRWGEVDRDDSFRRETDRLVARLEELPDDTAWFQQRSESPLRLVAYFSPEFGLSETLPQYSGGLGVLAGDHLKASSDLGLPLVAVGLLYREGYFRQDLDVSGWQQERFPRMQTASTGLVDTGVRVRVDMAGAPVTIAVWRVDVGRIPLYLLDTDLESNAPDDRNITDRLYGGDVEHRLRQEIVLGIGGVRALRALGLAPQVFHTNEGHAGFLALERIHEYVAGGLGWRDAIEATRSGGLFTTHTPVPAGIDRYSVELMQKYFGDVAPSLGCSFEELFALGEQDTTFNMAVLGLRLSARSNAVAALHGAVSRRMFQQLWPGATTDEIPIGSITNGVHAKTWVAPRIDALLSRSVDPVWDGASTEVWHRAHGMDDRALWAARREGRGALVDFVRDRLHADVLDPDALTIGFARRFATYKRATLLLSQPERLRSLLLDADRPVQFVFAGKAHPADNPGKEMIQGIERFARDLGVSHRFVFVPDYDVGVARTMYQGCDVWLNTPRRPLEACGTSGMKAALNGALNCSIADGWWDECADGRNGWTIASADDDPDAARRDQREARNLFAILEGDIVPTFYDGTPPTEWIARMKHAWATLGPFVTASRMVKDYTTRLYEPTAAGADRLTGSDASEARRLADWKSRMRHDWNDVHVRAFDGSPGHVRVEASLGRVALDSVRCELVHGPVDAEGEFIATHIEPLVTTIGGEGTVAFIGSYEAVSAGAYGATARLRAHHELLVSPVETGLITYV